MEIHGFSKSYLIYQIKCNETNKIYIGSTSNLTSRLNTHISSFKNGVSKCTSVKVLEKNNYSVTVLRSNIMTTQETKLAELNFILAFGDLVVNKNKPITCTMEEYMKKYQKDYYVKKKLIENENNSNII